VTSDSSLLETLGHHPAKHSQAEAGVPAQLAAAFMGSQLSVPQRLHAFPGFVRRQEIARFLVKYELFKLIVGIHGNIAECGVFEGSGLFSWSHFSSILEPYNHTRRIFGFDTFSGFPSVDKADEALSQSEHLKVGGYAINTSVESEISSLAAVHDTNRPLGHIPRIGLVVGDAEVTIPRFIAENPHVLFSLIYLDFDIYAPTKVALECLYPRLVPGGILAFDEINCPEWPGETVAALESIGIDRLPLQRLPFDPHISFVVKK
jgi:Macrocin-O-methyltransferase (TylF)